MLERSQKGVPSLLVCEKARTEIQELERPGHLNKPMSSSGEGSCGALAYLSQFADLIACFERAEIRSPSALPEHHPKELLELFGKRAKA